jgi:PAS domain S-box-containing protein/putative nucleotidyltransferase with HDIG domain
VPLLVLLLAPPLLQADEPLRVGLYQNPPKLFRDAGNRPAGLFVEILDAIARAEGWQLRYIDCEWNRCLRMLQRGELDLMPDVARSEARARLFDFHLEVVLSNWSQLYARESRPFQSLLDLSGQRIAVLAGSIQYSVLKERVAEFDVKPEFLVFNSLEETLQAVAGGRADLALLNRLYGLQYAGEYGLEPTHILVEASHLFFAATQGRHAERLSAIDRQLRAMKAQENSPYYLALQRWIEPLESQLLPRWIGWLAGGAAALLLLLGMHVAILRRTVRRKTEQLRLQNAALAESEAKYRNLFESSADAVVLIRSERLADANPAMLRMFGFTDRQALQTLKLDDIFPATQPDGELSSNAADRYIRQAYDSGYAFFEWLHRRADGTLFPAEVTLVPMQANNATLLQATIRDISRRKQNQVRLLQLNRALQTLSRVNHILVHAHNEEDLLDTICRTIVEAGGYPLAWVGFAEADEARTVRPVAQFGFDEGYLDTLRISWQDDEYGNGPTGTAIRSGEPSIVNDIHTDPRFVPWRERAEQLGYTASIALPLQNGGAIFGALNIYSSEPGAFAEEELALLQELAEDIAFGVQNQRMRREHEQLEEERLGHRERLQNSLLQTIQAITLMVEKRDPFTAGHQRRAAHLAEAIARELQLDPHRIEGIRFGAMIHDIGYIYVPAEILNRPGPLTGYELNIVRTHPQVGYDIVKDIDFPWPVAQMILQHHERLDGSGYPEGLKGEAILLEARILAVVDVIEAMLSHRPFRPALGMDDVLQELNQNRGIKYDEQVIDASLRLIDEKGYTLPE